MWGQRAGEVRRFPLGPAIGPGAAPTHEAYTHPVGPGFKLWIAHESRNFAYFDTLRYDERVPRKAGMKAGLVMIGSFVLLALVVSAAWASWDGTLLKDTPETKSAFLNNYSSQHLIERFRWTSPLAQAGPSMSYEPGKDFVSHRSETTWYLAMRSDKRLVLMTALADDVSAQLTLNGAQIISHSGDPQTGFHFDYKLGKTIGSVTISPVEMTSSIHRVTPLPPGIADVKATVAVMEKWFP
jgi:hypothetical protein